MLKTKITMIEITGKAAGTVKIFTDNIEDGAVEDVQHIADLPPYNGCQMRYMPDVHRGKNGNCIGFSSTLDVINGYVSPAAVGCDIGCTVSITFFDKPMPEDKIAIFEHRIKKEIPLGMNINNGVSYDKKGLMHHINSELDRLIAVYPHLAPYVPERFTDDRDIGEWLMKFKMEDKKFWRSIPSVGGGNHYVEYDVNEEDGKYGVCVHCGSRNLGQRVFQYWDDIASHKRIPKAIQKKITEEVKSKNTDKTKLKEKIGAALSAYMSSTPDGFVHGEDMYRYLVDVIITQAYASFNHKIIHNVITDIYAKLSGAKPIDFISTTHNYIDYDLKVLDEVPHPMVRKGAIRSYSGERMIIPFNMRDGIAICEGKSNPDWNWTAPHGAGRCLSRTQAFEKLKVDDFKKEMLDAGIYTTTADSSTLDEAPEAYKPKDEIVKLIEPTANILFFMKPKMNIKSAEKPIFSRKR